MANPPTFVSHALVTLKTASGDLIDFEDGETLSVDTTKEVKRVTPMTARKRSTGFRHGTKQVSGKLSVYVRVGPQPFKDALYGGNAAEAA